MIQCIYFLLQVIYYEISIRASFFFITFYRLCIVFNFGVFVIIISEFILLMIHYINAAMLHKHDFGLFYY